MAIPLTPMRSAITDFFESVMVSMVTNMSWNCSKSWVTQYPSDNSSWTLASNWSYELEWQTDNSDSTRLSGTTCSGGWWSTVSLLGSGSRPGEVQWGYWESPTPRLPRWILVRYSLLDTTNGGGGWWGAGDGVWGAVYTITGLEWELHAKMVCYIHGYS